MICGSEHWKGSIKWKKFFILHHMKAVLSSQKPLNSNKRNKKTPCNPKQEKKNHETKPTQVQTPHTCKIFEDDEALGQMPYMGEGNIYLFCPQTVASFLWAGDHLHPSDANTSSRSADYLFFFQIFISRLLCCPAHSSSSSFAWHKHVIFFL